MVGDDNVPFSLLVEAFNLVGMYPAKMEKMKELREVGKQVLNPTTWATIIVIASRHSDT